MWFRAPDIGVEPKDVQSVTWANTHFDVVIDNNGTLEDSKIGTRSICFFFFFFYSTRCIVL